jgi:hypothetical protein
MENDNAVMTVSQAQEQLSLTQVVSRVNLVHNVLKTIMKQNTHYGTVPGCGSKMVLLKPGADLLAMTFKLVPKFEVARIDLGNGHCEYTVTCSMCSPGGELLGQGVGSASTMEKKYRWRKDSKGNKIENEDIADVLNTVLKIAKKRAHIDATLTVTGAADLFTQDLIEVDEEATDRKPVTMPTPKAPPAPEKQKEEKPQAETSIIEGVIEDVSLKSGEKNGKHWKKYGVKIEGEWYGTFDTDIGAYAEEAKGKYVECVYKVDGKFKTIDTLCMLDKQQAPAQDELPM